MTNRTGLAALILAAGLSSRMGSFKPLLPLGRSTAIEETIRRFLEAEIRDIRVVLGHRSEEIVPILDRLEVRKIFNPEYEKGMFSSVMAGLKNMEPSIEAFFMLPADIPLVKPRTITEIVRAYRNSGAKIVYPCFDGTRGHPPLISISSVADLPEQWEGGLRAFLSRRDQEALDLEVVDEAILMDCDTPEDYGRLKAYGSRAHIPTERECMAIWKQLQTPESVISHSRVVAELAGALIMRLNAAGFRLDSRLVTAAGYLHDIARAKPDHAKEGAALLRDLGYEHIAGIVASHMDIKLKERSVDEADIVYLADKYVEGSRIVSIEERFEKSSKKFDDKQEILHAVAQRFKNARIIKERIEEALGAAIEEIIQKLERGMGWAANGAEKRIYLIRHGALDNPAKEKRYIGQLDLPLSVEGARQAELLRERLREAPLTAIYCSDLKRCMETADTIGEPHGLTPIAKRELREIALGAWEGASFSEIRRLHPKEFEERGRNLVHFRPPGGESFHDCALRVLPAFYEALQSTSGDILIVSHAGVNRILLCQIMGKPMDSLFEIDQNYGCLNAIRAGAFALEVEILNEVISPEKE